MNRRDFLRTMGIGVSTAAVGVNVVSAQQSPLGYLAASRNLAAASDPAWRTLSRLTFGVRPGQLDSLQKIGLPAYIEQQLAPDKINDLAADALISGYESLRLSVSEAVYLLNDDPAVNELDSATVLRAIYSQRQLYEVMVNFWSEHFSIWHRKELTPRLKTSDDRDVIRAYALGKFRYLLGASAKSPAMLIYLDNAKSVKLHANENYGREIMELHTITIGNYTEDDVKEVARCFTGWTLENQGESHPWEFVYRKSIHDDGPKTVLGHEIPAGGGQQDGETVLDILAAHPGTALHISSKLCRRFIADDPPENVVKACQDAFLQSSGDIPTVLRVIFASSEFLNAPPKFKRPFEFVVSFIRALDVKMDKLNPSILSALRLQGQLPFDHITPDGYTDYSALWQANLLPRWNMVLNTLYNKIPGVTFSLPALLKAYNVPLKPEAILPFFAQYAYGRALTDAESSSLLSYLNKGGAPDLTKDVGQKRLLDTIGLVFSGPAFQWR